MKPFAGGMLADAKLAIKFLLQFATVLPDPGVQSVEEIEEIVDIVDGSWELTAQEQSEIERIRADVGTRFCRRCGYCQPCPQGVEISLLMNFESYWKRFPVERFSDGWIAEAMESGRNCIQCGECEERCPYQLPIREMLAESLEAYERVTQQSGPTIKALE
jgi:predicted aldo/keto reductase-like oxidoreductase